MGLLASRFREAMKKTKDPGMEESVADVQYHSFLNLDYLNGCKVHVKKPNGEEFYYNSVGIVDGSSNMIIGRTHSGKTTAAIQMGANIIRNFPDATMFIDDVEGGSNDSRRPILTGFSIDEIDDRIIYRNVSVTAESFYERICAIYDEKIKNKDEYEYNTGLLDSRGREIYKLIPTVYILDSLAMLSPSKIADDSELASSMGATAMAKTNTAVFKGIVPKLKAANIILFVINHINDKIEINAFTHTKAQISGLKQNESLPGGKAALYLANNMIRVDDGAVLKESEGLGIAGKIVDFSFIKSRTNASGRSVPMVFTFDHGFDEILSLFMYMKSVGGIELHGSTCTLRGYPDIKFTQKGFISKLESDPEFAKIFNQVAKEDLEALLADSLTAEENPNISHQNIVNSILSL